MLTEEEYAILSNTANNLDKIFKAEITAPVVPNENVWWLVDKLTTALCNLTEVTTDFTKMRDKWETLFLKHSNLEELYMKALQRIEDLEKERDAE